MPKKVFLLVFALTACRTVTFTGTKFFVKTAADGPSVTLAANSTPTRFTMKDGITLDGYWVRTPEAIGTLLCLPGSGDSAGNMQQTLGAWGQALGLNVLVVDYRGAGRSEGTGSIAAVTADLAEVIAQWRALPERGPDRLIVYGVSMGSMAAARLAAENPTLFAAVILDSPAVNTVEWASNMVPWYAAPFVTVKIGGDLAALDTEEAVRGFTVPLLLVVGSDDKITPPAFAERVFSASASPARTLKVVRGAQHAEASDRPEFLPLVGTFVRSALTNQIAR